MKLSAARLCKLGVPLLLFVVCFAVYYTTLAPTITWAHDGVDGGDLITAAYTLGIAHPPGYPTYLLVGKLFTFLPLGDVAYRVNLMSAFFGAATVALVYLTVLVLLPRSEQAIHRTLIAAASALLLAFSHTFWSQAVIAEVYTLNAFFVALVVYLVTLWLRTSAERAGSGEKMLWAAAFVLGLSLGNHLSAVFLLPGILFLIIRKGHVGPKGWLAMGGLFLLGLGVYVYLPLRAAQRPVVNWGDPRTWSGFWWTVSGTIYRRYAFALPLRYLPLRLSVWARMLAQQVTWPGLALGLAGMWRLWRYKRDYLVFSLASFAVVVIYAITYNTTDSYVYLIPSYCLFVLWIACGAHLLLNELLDPWLDRKHRPVTSRRRLLLVLSLVLLLLPTFLLFSNYSSLDLSKDRAAYDYASQVFADVPADAMIIADTDAHIFALSYYRYVAAPESRGVVLVKGLIQYPWYRENLHWHHPQIIMPSGDDDGYALLLRAIEDNLPHREIYLTDPDDGILSRYPYRRVGTLYRLGA